MAGVKHGNAHTGVFELMQLFPLKTGACYTCQDVYVQYKAATSDPLFNQNHMISRTTDIY